MGVSQELDVDYAWVVDGEWMGSTNSPREALRYIEQYKQDGEIEIQRVVTYPMTYEELHELAAKEQE